MQRIATHWARLPRDLSCILQNVHGLITKRHPLSARQRVTESLTALILQQETSHIPKLYCNGAERARSRLNVTNRRWKMQREYEEMQRAMSYNSEKGASHWLGVLAPTEYGFSLKA